MYSILRFNLFFPLYTILFRCLNYRIRKKFLCISSVIKVEIYIIIIHWEAFFIFRFYGGVGVGEGKWINGL